MTQQPKALRLADWLEFSATNEDMGRKPDPTCRKRKAAAELRRLHEVNAELLEALCKLAQLYDAMNVPRGPCRIMADAAIAKATGEQL